MLLGGVALAVTLARACRQQLRGRGVKQYLALLRQIREQGAAKGDHAGTGTLSVFARNCASIWLPVSRWSPPSAST
jgi:hypothetical protein